MVRRRCGGTAVALALASAGIHVAVAQEYGFRFYGSAEGLRNPVVLSLAQDHEGYLWVGTEGGLYRYDGTRMHLMGQSEGLPCSTEVPGLFVAADGALWASTCSGVFRFDGRRFFAIDGIHTLLFGAQVMADGVSGRVLITTSVGLYEASRRADGSFSAHPYSLPPQFAGQRMHGILRHGERLWFGCVEQLCLEQAGRLSVFGVEEGLPPDAWDGIQIAPDGTVWVRSPKRIYRRAPGEDRFSEDNPNIATSGFWGAVSLTRDGSLMVPTDRGLAIYSKAGWKLVGHKRGLRNENTVAVLEDREGSVWVGMAGGGLARWLGRGVWESWRIDQGLGSDIVWNIRRERKGALWVGTSGGLTRIDASGRTRTWTEKDGLGGDNVRWLAEGLDGSIWAGMKPGGLARIDSISGKVRRIGVGDGLACDPEDVFVDRQGRLWLATKCGLFLNERPAVSNRVTRVNTPESFGRAWKLLEDTQGTIWVSNGKSLWSFRAEEWREHRRSDGLMTDHPYVMALARDGSIWLRHRYDAGIDRLEVSEGRIVRSTAVVPTDPKATAGAAFHGFDAFGNFWLGTAKGVAVLHADQWTTFTTEDGLVSNDCDGEAFWADSDGGVWMGTSGGLAHYSPGNAMPHEAVKATPAIVRLQVDQTSRAVRAEFSTLNFKVEQLAQFAYRLDGGVWTDSIERNISISGLGPGPHRLELRCRVRDGAFSPQITAADFQLARKWSESWWARLLTIALVLMAFTLFVRWRLSTAVRRQAVLEELVNTRTLHLSKVNRALDETTQELQASEDRLKNAERLAHLGHWDWDVRRNEFSWSEEVYRIFEIDRGHKPGYDELLQAVALADRERVKQWLSECLASRAGQSIEFQITRPNGDSRILSCTSEVSVDDKGLPARFFGSCQDITDSCRAQQEDFARKKLESVGILAGGIAHDFNNLLGGVLAQAEFALDERDTGSFPDQALIAIRNVAIRGSEIVRQLMIYAGKDSDDPVLVDVSQIVLETFELMKLSVSKRARVETDLGSQLPPVWASAAQIRQIVMNLVTNASDAIGDLDGVVRVTTRLVTPDVSQTLRNGGGKRDYLQLEVSDSGRGISPEIQTKVFDPFFTTKGAGHGLGLAVVQGIVRSLHGTIHMTSELGRGTTFQIGLPCAEGTAVGPTSTPVAIECPERAQPFVVLVVEDEDLLRQAVVAVLEREGFSVIDAADGATAIELLRANRGEIDVILLDVTIPGASSHDVMLEAAHTGPGIRVILTSAYSKEMLKPAMSSSQIHGFIRKPYRVGDLVHTLRSAVSA